MIPLTRARLAEIEALEKDASPRPFEAQRATDGKHTVMYVGPPVPCGDPTCWVDHRGSIFSDESISAADGDLLAALRNAAPQLLAAAKLVADIAERRCDCDNIATGDFGDRCDPCRARALVTT